MRSPSGQDSHKPRIVDSLAERAWGLVDKGPLTRTLFSKVLGQVREFVATVIASLSAEQLQELLADYLNMNGYEVGNTMDDGEFRVMHTSLSKPDGAKVSGFATVIRHSSGDPVQRFVERYSHGAFFHVLATEKVAPSVGGNVSIVSQLECTQVIVAVFLFDYLYREYFYSVTSMPGFKDHLFTHLADTIGLTKERLDKLDDAWERMKADP